MPVSFDQITDAFSIMWCMTLRCRTAVPAESPFSSVNLRYHALDGLFALSMLAQTPNPATDVSNADIQAFLKTLPHDKVSDLPIHVVDVGGYQVGIFTVFRPKSLPGDAILHETKRTEIYQILDGSGTLVTGGTLVDAHKDGANVRGSRIQGGVSSTKFSRAM